MDYGTKDSRNPFPYNGTQMNTDKDKETHNAGIVGNLLNR